MRRVKSNILATGAVLAMALIMAMATAVAAFADTTAGQGSYAGGGQYQNAMQTELIQALATASGQTTTQIQLDVTNGQTLPQIAQQLATAGTITQASLATAIQQAMASDDQTRASDMATNLISGPTTGSTGSTGSTGPAGSTGSTGSNGGTQPSGNGQGSMMVQALATASGQTTAQIQQDVTNGQTLSQIAQQLVAAGTITQASLANAIQQAMSSNEQQRASTMSASLISGQMPGRTRGNGTNGTYTTNGIVLTIGSSRMYVNGTAQNIDQYQTTPKIVNGHTFVPISAIIASLGGTASWSATDKTITITLNNKTVVLQIGSATATVNGDTQTLDNAPFISDTGRTMVPVAFISQGLGRQAKWDATARTVTIQ